MISNVEPDVKERTYDRTSLNDHTINSAATERSIFNLQENCSQLEEDTRPNIPYSGSREAPEVTVCKKPDTMPSPELPSSDLELAPGVRRIMAPASLRRPRSEGIICENFALPGAYPGSHIAV
jgi:hypothetical protein